MPITRDDYEKRSGEAFVLLKNFLRPNFHIAYTVEELVEVLEAKGVKMSKEEAERVLTSMVYGGRLESKIVDGVTCYRYKKVLGFLPMKRPR
ncbi:MAG TPA: hypothetical protein G4N91_01485 [Dehalococcoidia bacterium]|nr:hypothetical protein [Dehalococcoidia bacterium]